MSDNRKLSFSVVTGFDHFVCIFDRRGCGQRPISIQVKRKGGQGSSVKLSVISRRFRHRQNFSPFISVLCFVSGRLTPSSSSSWFDEKLWL